MNFKTHNESGRSMIELLGTLAIMGVISLAMIKGFGFAFLRYHSGSLMTDISLRAITFVHQMEVLKNPAPGTALFVGEFGDKTSTGFPCSGRVAEDTNYFEVIVSDVRVDICRDMLLNYTHPILKRVSVNGVENTYNSTTEDTSICGDGEQVDTMTFLFSKKFERN